MKLFFLTFNLEKRYNLLHYLNLIYIESPSQIQILIQIMKMFLLLNYTFGERILVFLYSEITSYRDTCLGRLSYVILTVRRI